MDRCGWDTGRFKVDDNGERQRGNEPDSLCRGMGIAEWCPESRMGMRRADDEDTFRMSGRISLSVLGVRCGGFDQGEKRDIWTGLGRRRREVPLIYTSSRADYR